MINVIIRPGLAASVRSQLEDGGMSVVEGIVKREAGAVNILAVQYTTRRND